MSLPKKGQAYEFFLSVTDFLDTTAFLANPTIAAGDFQISKDGGAFTNLAVLPTVLPVGGVLVRVSLSADEMDADKVNVLGVDQAGDEWLDILAAIDVPSGNIDTAVDILEGDHVENNISLVINKKGTSTAVLDKQIKGSLLQPDIVITTEEAP